MEPEEAVSLFKQILLFEAGKKNIPITNINCPGNITSPDGGIDASIKSVNSIRTDIIIADDVRFQIKTGKKKPWDKNTIVKELFGCSVEEFNKLKEEKSKKLKPAIKKCLDDGAAYVYVTFKHAFVEKDLNKTTALLRQYFDQCGYSDCNVAVWGYEQLNNVIEKNYPALLLDIKTSLTNSDCTLYKTISQRSDLRNKYFEDERRKNIISEVQKLLKAQNKNNKAMHIRILGASGIGKTKTVVQILDDNDLKCNCIFFESPEKYDNSNLENYIRENKNIYLILVIDECDSKNAEKILNAIEYNASNMKLITIYNSNGVDMTRGETFIVKELSEEVLPRLIEERCPDLRPDIRNKIVRLCEGFPRVAMIV
ncbi:MAG: hypothetical protein LBU33_02220, partial [Endomicrobium sp.]|nr:hypothetical protein [Endomicrobium sp.]